MTNLLKISWIGLLLLVLFFAACKDDEMEMQPTPPQEMPCDVLDELRASIGSAYENNIYIKSVQEFTEHVEIVLENDQTFLVDLECILSTEIDSTNWLVSFDFSDGVNQEFGFLGRLEIDWTVNPSGYAPLSALLEVNSPVPGQIHIRVVGKNGPNSDIYKAFDAVDISHEIPVHGLYEDYENTVEVIFAQADGTLRFSEFIQIPVEKHMLLVPEINITVREFSKMEPGLTLVSSLISFIRNVPYMFDAYGDIRWILDYETHDDLKDLFYDVGIERLQNGNLYFGDKRTSRIYEIDLFGEVLNSWEMPGYFFHHNVQEKPNGNFLVTVNKWGSMHLNGNYTVEDHIIEIDRNSGNIIMEWDLRQSLDEYRTALLDLLDDQYVDWVHCNAVLYDPSDNTIIVSGRTQGVFKLDYDNQVKWILGSHLAWGENRMGQDLNQFLLEATDGAGNPLNDDVQLGYDNHAEFEWNWYQHAPLITPNGNIMLFDNGDNRNFSGWSGYSRAVEFDIDEENMQVRQIWQYGKERGAATRSRIISDVDILPQTGHIMFCPGHNVENSDGLVGAKVVELDYDTKEVFFEAEINSLGLTLHRAERMTLYPE